MNVENINALAAFVETHTEKQFHMGGTTTCWLGFVAELWPDAGTVYDGANYTDEHLLAAKLGVSWDQVQDICFWAKDSTGEKVRYDDISRERAVTAMRRLAATGHFYY